MYWIVFLLYVFVNTLALADEFKVPFDKYHLGKKANVGFKAFGGGFYSFPTSCNSYPCNELFKKSWNTGCLVREVYLAINPATSKIVNIVEQFGGRCNGRGDHPLVKTLIGEGKPKPKWLKNWNDGTVNATWVFPGGYMWMIGLCRSIANGQPFKKFSDCYVKKVSVHEGDANTAIRSDFKANNMEY